MSNVMQSTFASNDMARFYQQFFAGAGAGKVNLFLKPLSGKVETLTFDVSDVEGIAKATADLAGRGDAYFERSSQKKGPARGKRGTVEGVAQTFGLSIDIDTGEGPHSTPADRLPRDVEEVLALVQEAGLPPPTFVIHTGGGVHLHWCYTAPFTIVTAADRAQETALSKAWQDRLAPVFAARDYELDRTFSLEHLFRAPGTHNFKAKTGAKPVAMARDMGPRIERGGALASVKIEATATRVAGKGKAGGVSALLREQGRQAHIAKAKEDQLAPILAGCAWMKHCEDDAATLKEPEWHAMLGISGRCENGRELSHKLSEPHAGYSEQGTDDKLHHATHDAGPVTCQKVATEFGFAGCARCPFRASITSPIQLGAEPLRLVQEQRRAVYILELRRWMNLTTGRFLSPDSFGDAIQARVGKAPHSLMMSSKSTARVDAMDYLAGTSQLIVRGEDGALLVNLWQDTGVKAAAGDPGPILDYFAHFIPDTRSREHVIRYLAYLVQRPSVKIEHGVIVTGGFGTGKGTLRAILRILLGASNVKKIEGEELSGKNNMAWVNRQVVIFEEAVQSGKFEVYNRTKELVTDEFFRVQDKYIPLHDGRTPRGIFIMSNDNAPIALPSNDRRWFICDTPETPETDEEKATNKAFFKALHDRLEGDPAVVAAFRHYLLTEVDLATFTAKGAPPTTAAKARATEESRTPIARVLADLIQAGDAPFHRDIVSAAQALDAIANSEWATTLERMSPKKLSEALRSVGGFPVNVEDGHHKQVRVARNLAPRLYGIRNKANWAHAPTDELRTEWLGGKPATEAEVVQLHASGLDRIMRKAR